MMSSNVRYSSGNYPPPYAPPYGQTYYGAPRRGGNGGWEDIPMAAWPGRGAYGNANGANAPVVPAAVRAPRGRRRGCGPCCIATSVVVGLILVGAAVGVGVFFYLHDKQGSNGNGGNGGSSNNGNGSGAGGGGGGGVSGSGTSIQALANANLQGITGQGCPFGGTYSFPWVIGGETFPRLILDTGSSTTGIAASDCASCNGVTPEYSPGSSATNTGKTAQSKYADQSGWSGTIYTDSMGAGDKGSTAVPMNIVAISSQSSFFNDVACAMEGTTSMAYQGIVGVGPPPLELAGTNDFITDWANATGNPAAFTVSFCDVGGELTLGGFNPNAMAQTPQAARMVSGNNSPFYSVNVKGMSLGGTALVSSASSDINPMVMDTGTSILLLPADVYSSFLQTLSSNQAFVNAFPSLLQNSNSYAPVPSGQSRAQLDQALPPLVVTLDNGQGGDLTLTLPATSSYLVPVPRKQGDSTAGGYGLAVASSGISATSGAVFGCSAMRALNIVFDVANQQIGFAPQNGCSGNLS